MALHSREGKLLVYQTEQNTLSYLRPLAEAGLGLPNDVTLKDSTVSLDFALNRFKGSLEGASIDLSNKQGDEAISANQVLRLLNRDLGAGLGEGSSAFVSLDDSATVQIGFTTSDDLTNNTVTRLAELGFEEVVGEISPKSSVKLIDNTNLVLNNAKVKGVGELSDLLSIVNGGNANLIDGVTLEAGTTSDLNSVKKLIGVASEKLNLNDVKLSDTIISPEDFFQVYDRATFEDTAVIAGHIDSTAQGLDLVSLATIPLNGVLLKDETGPIRADAESLMTLSQNGIALFDQINPTAIVTDVGLSVQQALELGNARLDLSEHHIIDGERADLYRQWHCLIFKVSISQG